MSTTIRWSTAAALCALAVTGCDPTNPCSVGRYDPGPPRACVLPDGGTILLDEPDAARADVGPGDGAVDARADEPDACATTWFRDADEDGHGIATDSVVACVAPDGYVASSDDCDDDCASCVPGGVEVCDGHDQNCDGTVDGDDLCEFGMGCIDGGCSAIPILEWHVQIEAGPDGRSALVVDVQVRPVGPDGGMLALVTSAGSIRIGTETILATGTDSTTVRLVRLTAAGEVIEWSAVAEAVTPSRLSAGGFDVDAAGRAWITGSFTGSASVLGRTLRDADGGDFVVSVTGPGTGLVQRYPGLSLGPIVATDGGFASCGRISVATTVAGDLLVPDAGGDVVIVRGDATGNLTAGAMMTSTGIARCAGLAADGDVVAAAGSYEGSAASIGGTALPIPGRDDLWLAAFRADMSLAWWRTGGGALTDIPGEVGWTPLGTFVPVASMGRSSFCGETPESTESFVLVQASTDGSSCTTRYDELSGDDVETPPTLPTRVPQRGPVPVAALTLVRQFISSQLRFGSAVVSTTSESEVALLGYSADGAAPRWVLQLDGAGFDEARSLDWQSESTLVLAGVFDADIALSEAVSLGAARGLLNGFVAGYRVR